MKEKDAKEEKIESLFSVQKIKEKILKECMEIIINKENVWDQMLEADVVEGPIQMTTP